MIVSNKNHIETVERKLSCYKDELIDIGSSVNEFNHQLRESGIVVDSNSSSDSRSGSSGVGSSSSNNSPIRVKVARFDEGRTTY